MSAPVYTSVAAGAVLASLPATKHAAVFSPLPHRSFISATAFKQLKGSGRQSRLMVKASSSKESPIDASELFMDLKEKWDALENKSTVLLYGGGAIVGIWLASIVVSAVNSVPLLPKIMELVGLGYTGWFVYRYLLFKSSRKELVTDIEALKKKVAGTE